MSHRPRRTAELGDGSQPRPSRASRIAQPIRRPSMKERSLERAPSIDRLTVGYQTASAIKGKKSTLATPLRTPSSVPRTELSLTTEKEKAPSDKKWIQTQAARVTEYLHCIETTLGGDFFNKGGLKTMTTKQFVTILKHFLSKIVGNRLTIGANYVDDVAKILSQIGYPYTVNKSWLKTPSAPHAYNNVVLMLQWFLPFAAKSDFLSEFEAHLAPSEFPDKNFAQAFMRKAEEGFILWNNSKDDELQALQENFVDELIKEKTGIKGIKAIEKEIHQINADLDDLFRNKVVLKREDEFIKLSQEVKTKEKLFNKLLEKCQGYKKQLSQLKDAIGKQNEEIASVKKRNEELQYVIASQEMSAEEREELCSKIGYLKQYLRTKKNSVSQLDEMGTANQILLSRLLNRKMELVSKFNNYIYQIFSETDIDTIPNVTEFCIHQNSELDLKEQIQKVLSFLEQLSKRNLEEFRRITSQISELQSQLNMATYTHDKALEQPLAAVMQRRAETEKTLEELNIALINSKVGRTKKLEELVQTFREIAKKTIKMRESIASKEFDLKNQQTINKEMLDMFQQKVKNYTKEQIAANERLAEAINRFKVTMDTLEIKLNNLNESSASSQ